MGMLPDPFCRHVSAMASHATQWRAIGDALEAQFGSALQSEEVIQVRVPVRTCLAGVCGASLNTFFIKPCGKTFKEAALDISTGGGSTGGGSGGGESGPNPGEGDGGTPFPPGGGGAGCVVGCVEAEGRITCECIQV